MPPLDTSRWQSHGPPPPPGHPGPPCRQCGVSTHIEIGGGGAAEVCHPNLDIRSIPGVDMVLDLETGVLPFHDGHATWIRAVHSLQHLSRTGARAILRECHRILAPGGSIYVMINDMAFLAERLHEDGIVDEWLSSVFHDSSVTEEGFHKWGYSFATMKAELEAAGFTDVSHAHYYNRWDLGMIALRRA